MNEHHVKSHQSTMCGKHEGSDGHHIPPHGHKGAGNGWKRRRGWREFRWQDQRMATIMALKFVNSTVVVVKLSLPWILPNQCQPTVQHGKLVHFLLDSMHDSCCERRGRSWLVDSCGQLVCLWYKKICLQESHMQKLCLQWINETYTALDWNERTLFLDGDLHKREARFEAELVLVFTVPIVSEFLIENSELCQTLIDVLLTHGGTNLEIQSLFVVQWIGCGNQVCDVFVAESFISDHLFPMHQTILEDRSITSSGIERSIKANHFTLKNWRVNDIWNASLFELVGLLFAYKRTIGVSTSFLEFLTEVAQRLLGPEQTINSQASVLIKGLLFLGKNINWNHNTKSLTCIHNK